jgi:predicted nucleic acid-binding Zn ribbon protein|tara:strand:- start:147 stop:404 length:258 start_codon:yes stop_codon:yes gene_type:complete
MTRRIFEFQCNNDHVFEQYIDDSLKTTTCPACDTEAKRIISKPRIDLEGCSGDFPTAADAWVRRRESHMKYERKMGIGQEYSSMG